MKTKPLLITIVSSFFVLHSAFGQGALTPPGAPAPTMKTLAQVEPRTPISSAPFTIANSGSYYLTTNLTTTVSNAIVVAANGVTLDLSGFTISSTVANAANGGTAILIGAGLSDISIFNGHVRGGVANTGGVYSGPGFATGIGISFSGTPANIRVSCVSVAACLNSGIYLGNGRSTVVEACMVRTIGIYGIYASTIKGSVVEDCESHAVYGDQVSDCRGESTDAYGIYASTAQNCSGFSSTSSGINAVTALNCDGESNTGIGLSATTAQNCYGYSGSSGPGILAETASNCYGQALIRGVSANIASSCSGRSSGGSYGVFATSIANTCYGISATGTGLGATIAIGCIGVNNSGPSVLATYKFLMP